LSAAGLPFVVEGGNGPEHVDFHALRYTFITLLGRSGTDLRAVQMLAGHSSPTLTARYSLRDINDLAAAVGRLPRLTA
jgi:integrase